MLFNRDLKRTAAIRFRPLGDGTYLYFPYDYRFGGKGYIADESTTQRYRLLEWAPLNFFLVPFLFITALGLVIGGMKLHGMLFGAALGIVGAFYFHRSRVRLFAELTRTLKSAPGYVLSEERYWREYTAQCGRAGFLLFCLFWTGLPVTLIISLVTGGSTVFQSALLTGIHLAGMVIVVINARRIKNMIRFRFSRRANKELVQSLEGLKP